MWVHKTILVGKKATGIFRFQTGQGDVPAALCLLHNYFAKIIILSIAFQKGYYVHATYLKTSNAKLYKLQVSLSFFPEPKRTAYEDSIIW